MTSVGLIFKPSPLLPLDPCPEPNFLHYQILLNSIYSIIKFQNSPVETAAVKPTDQVLMSKRAVFFSWRSSIPLPPESSIFVSSPTNSSPTPPTSGPPSAMSPNSVMFQLSHQLHHFKVLMPSDLLP